ncbi:MAG: glycoside hydrolase family 3 C-terminal domain-containing protein, partial [Kangiellaceae bacterium]|nr:glycoside hydrolase family 3 C-terminal domain-containing protein [Kangiellaceae bacterium]
GYVVVHGFKTIFPSPLAETASWDMAMLEKTAHVAAEEASASGINWVFAPMVDLARDARWGRVSEGAGEDPYLASLAAAARVRGFQGDDLKNNNTVAATAKHFAAYGAAEAGKDYNTVDMSENLLREVYLKPFQAAAAAGVASMMSAFNEVNGVPATANKKLLTDILHQEWGFQGFVVSDFASIGELINHGYAANKTESARLSINAGMDMDMEAAVYKENIVAPLLEQNQIKMQNLDDSVKRILSVKYDLGLFDDAYKYTDEQRAEENVFTQANIQVARDMARKSIVLLKNNDNLLPLDFSQYANIAMIGPIAKSQKDPMGTWTAVGESESVVTMFDGLARQLPEDITLHYAKGCEIDSDDTSGFKEAIKIAKTSDLILLTLGERWDMSGEAASKGNIGLPGVQSELLSELAKLNKPIVLILSNGRPLAIEQEVMLADSILETWLLGTASGDAIADILTGKYNPSGKLPITFPRNIGQVPIYYNHKNTGRPANEKVRYSTRYLDISFKPLFVFGYGLSYSNFEYSGLSINKNKLSNNEILKVSIELSNIGKVAGEEVVQLYIRDLVGSVTRPVRELKAFKKIMLQAGETSVINFEIIPERDLAFTRSDLTFGTENGDFQLFIGTDSSAKLSVRFKLENEI